MKLYQILLGVAAAAVILSLHLGRVQGLNARIAQLEEKKAQVDTLYVTDTLELTRVRREIDTLVIRDTVVHRDTVIKWLAAERRACNAVIETCEKRVAIRDTIIINLKRQRWHDRIIGAGAGAVIWELIR